MLEYEQKKSAIAELLEMAHRLQDVYQRMGIAESIYMVATELRTDLGAEFPEHDGELEDLITIHD